MCLKKIIFLTVLFFISTSSLAMEPDVLLIKQLIDHGAPVQSVSWCCNELFPDQKYAAIGGYLGTGDKYVRVYNFNRTTGLLTAQDSLPNSTVDFSPESFVYSVDWCCQLDGSDPLLAVGGADGMVHVYSYTGDPRDTLVFQASFTHGAPIHAVSWLCGCCDTKYLAIAGETASDNKEIRILIRILQLYGNTLIQVGSGIHGNTVFSLDWCCMSSPDGADYSKAYLAAGGKPSSLGGSGCLGPNLRIFCFQCLEAENAPFMPIISMKVTGTTLTDLHAVRWCCDENVKYRKLAVGGKKVAPGGVAKNMWLYYLVNNRLLEVASSHIGGVEQGIYAIDWNPYCKCSNLTFGGGCRPTPACEDNIFIHKQTQCNLGDPIFATRYDDNVTSLEWCGDNGKSYLLVGTEVTGWGDPEVCPNDTNPEVVLYVAAFCNPQATSICQRALW